MSSAVSAARACARTILWQSLRLSAFQGATPHVLFVVDQSPCALQKILLEGYLQALDGLNGAPPQPTTRPLRVDLDPSATTPRCGMGLDRDWRVTYSVMPFCAETFLNEVQSLQAFLRQCGQSTSVEKGGQETLWSEEKMASVFASLVPLLAPCDLDVVAGGDCSAGVEKLETGGWREALLRALRVGPQRELLGCILIQRNAFQNEMEKYRLRLDLFNMGLRVAEHNHLECMSRKADALASAEDEGAKKRCLEESEVVNYMHSCSMEPHIAESIGRAIADSIDAWSWERRTAESDGSDGLPVDVMPPASLQKALANRDLWSVYNEGVLTWREVPRDENSTGNGEKRSECAVTNVSAASLKITGPGAPLRIICHDGHVLSFEGGLENCLINTGYYAAAHAPERNTVCGHRQRFPVHEIAEDRKNDSLQDMSATDEASKRGRLKKKDYVAMLKLSKLKTSVKRPLSSSDDHDDDVCRSDNGNNDGGGMCVGSSIGGTFPVGEVISESFDLSKLNGTCTVFAYPSLFKELTMAKPRPVEMRIEKGIVTDIGPDAPEELVELIDLVRQTEGACYVRELGIGLSPFVGKKRIVSDVTAFERQFGVHVSLGKRHPLFVKQAAKRNADGSVAVRVDGPVLKRKAGKYHIDVFLDAARLEMGAFAVDFTKGARGSFCDNGAAAAVPCGGTG